jgi:hypothetical protein
MRPGKTGQFAETWMNSEKTASASEETTEGMDLTLLKKAGERSHGPIRNRHRWKWCKTPGTKPVYVRTIQSPANVGQTMPTWQSTLVNPARS